MTITVTSHPIWILQVCFMCTFNIEDVLVSFNYNGLYFLHEQRKQLRIVLIRARWLWGFGADANTDIREQEISNNEYLNIKL